jgi:hypothetical protein
VRSLRGDMKYLWKIELIIGLAIAIMDELIKYKRKKR